MEERREELTEQFAELQKRLKAQALEQNIIRNELQQARSELEAIIFNSKSLVVTEIASNSIFISASISLFSSRCIFNWLRLLLNL